MLRKAGFVEIRTRGSHTTWGHPRLPVPFTLSGKDGDDAEEYQEKLVAKAMKSIGDAR